MRSKQFFHGYKVTVNSKKTAQREVLRKARELNWTKRNITSALRDTHQV